VHIVNSVDKKHVDAVNSVTSLIGIRVPSAQHNLIIPLNSPIHWILS